MMKPLALALMLLPAAGFAGGLSIENPMIPLAPPSAMTHAGYLTLVNEGSETRHLVGVTSESYAMAHLHQSAETEGVATMTMVHQIDIAPGQTIAFAPGGLHVMLMRPNEPLKSGGMVEFTLHFANGETVPVSAKVMKLSHNTHAHDS